MYFLNFLGTFFLTFVVIMRVCIPSLEESWRKPWTLDFVLLSWFKSMLPGTLLLVLIFFGILHSWQNVGAEVMRFGDREFYTDWWNVTNFGAYYRKWNNTVHEWLYHYVY